MVREDFPRIWYGELQLLIKEMVMASIRWLEERVRFNHKGLTMGVVVLIFILACTSVNAKDRPQKNYPSPDEAVKAMVAAVKAGNTRLLMKIFGPGSKALVLSGDPLQDKKGRERFIQRFEEKNRLEETEDKAILYLGKDEWPYPIPIVKTEKGWKFDTAVGRQEILARRVGRNELSAIQVCLAYVDAQKEYAFRKGSGDRKLPEYAQELISTPGKQNGLYWEAEEGQEKSPMGPLFAAARDPANDGKGPEDTSAPYHGYLYRILKAQGKNAPGGARDYVLEDRMISGFALIAYPARYGASGVMTFMVNQNGVVYQKDLGKKTRESAQNIMAFDPDETWVMVKPVPVPGS
jgi:hypothetical protein